MPTWMKISCDGTRIARINVPQERVYAHLGGPVTFVGAIPSLNAIIVARADAPDMPVHACMATRARECFFDGAVVRGDIAVIASGENGEEEDLDVRAATAALFCRDTASPQNVT